MDSQQPLFYEDIMDAIAKMVNGNPQGLSIKQIAMELWPARNPDTGRSTLSRSLSPEHHDQNLNPEELDKIMEITRAPEHVINYLCDKYGFERPSRKDKESFKKEVRQDLKGLMEQLKHISRKVETLESEK